MNRSRIVTVLVASLVLIPLLTILGSFFKSDPGVWVHFWNHLLGELAWNSFILAGGVLLGTLLLGVGLSWIVVQYEFPGRRFFEWALVLPLAVPAYVFGFVYLDLFDFSGLVPVTLRNFGVSTEFFPAIRSPLGVIFVMTLAFYPYVFLLTRNAFQTQCQSVLEASQSLGKGPFNVAFSMARPWVVGGATLVLMETLADFGTVSTFNYSTFTTGIYKAWFGMFSISSAAQLASILVAVIFVCILFEQKYRNKMQVTSLYRRTCRRDRRIHLGKKSWALSALLGTVFSFSFVFPVLRLLYWSLNRYQEDLSFQYFLYGTHSLVFSSIAAILVMLVAFFLSYSTRRYSDLWNKMLVRLSTIGYALPGTVLAVGFFIPFAWVDQYILPESAGLLLSGTVLTMLLAYLVRFLAVGHHSVEGSMRRVTPSIDEAAKSLGANTAKIVTKIHLPMLKGGILTGALLVFVEVMKEMPITLMTRPFGWDTLAVRVFEMTSEGEWELAALPSMGIVLAGLIPVFILVKNSRLADRSAV